MIREAIFLASQKVFVEDPGKDVDKVVLGSFPRFFRIFTSWIQGFSDRSWSKCLPRSLKFLYRCCYDLKSLWFFTRQPDDFKRDLLYVLRRSLLIFEVSFTDFVVKVFQDRWSFFTDLVTIFKSLWGFFTDLAKILHGSLKLLACFWRIFERSAHRTCARFQSIES